MNTNKEIPLHNSRVESFILTVGRVTFEDCLQAVKKQSAKSKISIIRNVEPMSAAFQQMFESARLPYFIQIDEDMILDPWAIQAMEAAMDVADPDVVFLCFELWDTDRDQKVDGIKIYRTELIKKFHWKNRNDSEMDLIRQIDAAGLKWQRVDRVVGQHVPCYNNLSAFEYYRGLTKKEVSKFRVISDNFFKKMHKLDINFNNSKDLFSFCGIVSGIVEATKYKGLCDGEKKKSPDKLFDVFNEAFRKGRSTELSKILSPKISVIMAVNKIERLAWLREAIESVLGQIFTDFEFIIVANDAEQRVLDVLDEYQKKDDRIKILYLPEANLVKALNAGIKEARGEYIARMDADDVSDCMRFVCQYLKLEKNPNIAVLGCNGEIIDENGKHIAFYHQPENGKALKAALKVNNAVTHGSVMARAEILKKFKYSEEPYAKHIEDYELWIRLFFQEGFIIENLQLPLFKYRAHKTSVSQIPESGGIQRRNLGWLHYIYEKELSGKADKYDGVNKTFDVDDLDKYNSTVEILQKIRFDAYYQNAPYNIDGLDNGEMMEKPRFWEYSHAVHCVDPQGKNVLDAGSGYSIFPILLSRLNAASVNSCDINFQAERQLQAGKLNADIGADFGSFLNLPYTDESFDAVYCISCLEHLKDEADITKALGEFGRVLRQGGKLFLSVDYHKNYIEYGQAGWQWSESTRYFNNEACQEKIMKVASKEAGLNILGNANIIDNTNWENPPLYGKYTFASMVFEKTKK